MRTLPQTEVRSLPAPSPQENQTSSIHRGDGHHFAETLQRKSTADERPAITNKKTEPPEKSAANDATERIALPTKRPPADDAKRSVEEASTEDLAINVPIIVEPSTQVTNPLTLGDLGLALAMLGNATELTVEPSATPEILPAFALPAISTATNATADANPLASTETTTVAVAYSVVAGDRALNDLLISVNALFTGDSATPDLATAMSAAAVIKHIPSTPNAQIADTQLVTDAVEAVANDGDPTVALPPMTASLASEKNALSAKKEALSPIYSMASLGSEINAQSAKKEALPAIYSDDTAHAELVTPFVSNAPINSATPATQTAGMNAVAAAIGDAQAEKTSADSGPLATKTVNESALTPLPPTPAAQTAVTRPMSETVLAQSTLAANGNPMEKVLSHQVSKALIQHLPNGDRVLVMRLTPPELGTVKIEVIERMGVLTAKLHAEDDGVRLALERFLPSMRQDLRASDAPIRELSMSDQTQFQRSFADGQNQQQQQNAESSNRRARADEPRFAIDGARSDTVTTPRSAPLGGRVSLSEVNALA